MAVASRPVQDRRPREKFKEWRDGLCMRGSVGQCELWIIWSERSSTLYRPRNGDPDMLRGSIKTPFASLASWAEDVSADVAHEIPRCCNLQLRDVPFFLQDFVDRYEGR
jgi:hypothetical protein